MSRKQEIYKEMLRWGLPHLRNVLAQGVWQRLQDRSCLLEAQLLHSLPNTILEEQFVEGDLWFLNHDARAYLAECSPAISPNYQVHAQGIRELFTLVPPEAREKLKWKGP